MAQNTCVFITAAEARHNPIRDRAVHDEARGLEEAVLDAVKLGLFEVTVKDGTPMTNSSVISSDVWTADSATDQLYVPAHGFSNGDIVMVSSTIALPAPLKTNAYYYVIYIDNDHIKLADSYANAVSGRPISIDITAGLTSINVTNSGSGYIQPPFVQVSGGGATVDATARAYLSNTGSMIAIANPTPGSGYTDTPVVTILPYGSGATASSVNYKVVGMIVANGGSNYHVGDLLSVTGGTGPGPIATALVTDIDNTGAIQSISLSNPGNYSVLPVLVGAETSVLPGGGTDATVNLTFGISEVVMATSGAGYVAPPVVEFEDTSGTGAIAVANLIGGTVDSVTVTSPGYGYVGDAVVSFDSGSNATAVVSLIPTGVGNISLTDNGSDSYTSAPSVTISTIGTGAAIGAVYMTVIACHLTSPGIGYTINDTLLVAGGVATSPAWIRVTNTDTSGRIIGYVLEEGGAYTGLPNLNSNPVNGGTGNLAGFNLVMGLGEITVSNGGSGYVIPPIIAVVDVNEEASTPATGNAVLDGDEVVEIKIANPGYGYTAMPTVTISNGSGAVAAAVLVPTTLDSAVMTNVGSGYTYADVTISGGGAITQATAIAILVGDTVATINIVTPGSGYTEPPTITITGDGIDATATAILTGTSIAEVVMIEFGSGYNSTPIVTIPGLAEGIAILQPTGIDQITVIDQGSNYTSDPAMYITPGANQVGTAISATLVAQRGFGVSHIAITNNGEGYQSAISVEIAAPQAFNGIQAEASATIGIGAGTFALRPYPVSRDYFRAWKSQPLSNEQLARPYIERMDTIIAYFTNMGYTINRLTNPATNTTLMWKIQW